MYYYSEATMEVDDLIKEFLDFKNGKSEIMAQSQKPLEIIKEYLELDQSQNLADSLFSKHCDNCAKNIEKQSESQAYDEELPILSGYVPDTEPEYMNLLLSETNRRLLPYVEEALDGFEFDGSPAYAERVEKDIIAKVVDKAVELAAKNIVEISDIQKEMHRHPWTPARILRACIESLTLSELSYRRRLMFVSVSDFTGYKFL